MVVTKRTAQKTNKNKRTEGTLEQFLTFKISNPTLSVGDFDYTMDVSNDFQTECFINQGLILSVTLFSFLKQHTFG